MLQRQAATGLQSLDLLDGGLELRRAVGPLLQQLHGLVEVLHVLGVHLEEGSEFLQDVPDARFQRPAGGDRGKSLNDINNLLDY